MDKSEVLMKLPISVDFKIDFLSYAAYIHKTNTQYDLAAVVCHKTFTKWCGHFITHLRTGTDTIKTLDDNRPSKINKLNTLLRLNTFQSTVYMVVCYI